MLRSSLPSRTTTLRALCALAIGFGAYATYLMACGTSSPTTPAAQADTSTITNPTLPNGVVGSAYSDSLTVTGGTSPYTFAMEHGSLPSGLSIDQGGTISGTPMAATAGDTFFVAVTDSKQVTTCTKLVIVVTAPTPLAITTTSPLPGATVGTSYSDQLVATGGTPPYTWSSAPAAPPGLTLDATTTGSTTAGLLHGTPTLAGTTSMNVSVSDAASNFVNKNLSLTVSPPPCVITPTTLPAATNGQAYSAQLTALPANVCNSTDPVSYSRWQRIGGTIPPDFILQNATGSNTVSIVNSNPQDTPGTYTFMIEFFGAAPTMPPSGQNATATITLVINP